MISPTKPNTDSKTKRQKRIMRTEEPKDVILRLAAQSIKNVIISKVTKERRIEVILRKKTKHKGKKTLKTNKKSIGSYILKEFEYLSKKRGEI